MISRNSEGGFFAAHWDWLVAAVGVAALVVGVVLFVMTGGGDPDENARVAVDRLKLAKRSETGVKPVDMSQYERALQFAVKPATISEIEDAGGNFLVSARRVFCKFCKKPIHDGTRRTTPTPTRTATASPMPRSMRRERILPTRTRTLTTSIRLSSCFR